MVQVLCTVGMLLYAGAWLVAGYANPNLPDPLGWRLGVCVYLALSATALGVSPEARKNSHHFLIGAGYLIAFHHLALLYQSKLQEVHVFYFMVVIAAVSTIFPHMFRTRAGLIPFLLTMPFGTVMVGNLAAVSPQRIAWVTFVVFSICLFVFISQAVHLKQAALRRESEQRSQALLDAIPYSLLRIDQSGLILQVRASPGTALFAHLAGLEGRRLPETDDERFPVPRTVITEVLEDGIPKVVQRRIGAASAAVDAEVRVNRSGRGEALVVIRDTTLEEAIEGKLIRTARLATLGTVMAGVAHELNNPLAFSLLSLSDVERLIADLGDRIPDDERQAIVESVRDATMGAERVQAVARSLATHGRVRPGELEPIDVLEAIETAVKFAGADVRRRATLKRNFAPCPKVIADPPALSQVILNLLLNALHALPDRPISDNEIEIRARPTANAGQVLIDVIDNGDGIERRHLDRVFEPFFTTKNPGKGTGLGLFVSQKTIHGLGGTMHVESAVGHGTTVRVTLPCSPGVTKPRAREVESPTPPIQARGRILVVDDEAAVCRSLVRILRGHDVTTAEGASAALRICEREVFNLVFCDLMMPGIDGIMFYQLLKKQSQSQSESVVFMTGGAFMPHATQVLGTLANPVISKPFDIPGLRSLVRDHLATQSS